MNKQAGLSIVELMISVVIGLVVIAGAVQVVLNGKRNFLDQDEVTFIQNNARYAVDTLSRDLRMAGYLGCAGQGTAHVANSINSPDPTYISLAGLQGFDGSAGTSGFPADYRDDVKSGTDSFIVRRADDSVELDVKHHNAHAAQLDVWQQHNYQASTPLIIADATCKNIGFFEVSGPNGLPSNNIVHNTGASTNNCTTIIKGNFVCEPSCTPTNCKGANVSNGSYGPGAKVMGFLAHAYYIGESSVVSSMPALKRRVLNSNTGTTMFTEELALGVEDMQVTYGVDIDGNGAVDRFVDASAMDLNGNGVITAAEWEQALTVQVTLVMRSQNVGQLPPEERTIAGTTYNDRYIRQTINTTVRIRNRG